jgi:hypothetical protein
VASRLPEVANMSAFAHFFPLFPCDGRLVLSPVARFVAGGFTVLFVSRAKEKRWPQIQH